MTRRELPEKLAGMRVILDESVAPDRVIVTNNDGRGYALERGEITPAIVPPIEPRIRRLP